MTRVYYKEAAAAFVVFDVTRAGTFDGVAKWKRDLDDKILATLGNWDSWQVRLADGGPIPAVLLANKCDLEDVSGSARIGQGDLDEFCADQGFLGWRKTSAKEGTGVAEAAEALIAAVVDVEERGQYEVPVRARDPNVRRLPLSGGGAHSARPPKTSHNACQC